MTRDSIKAAQQPGVNIDTIKIGDPYWIIQDNIIYYAKQAMQLVKISTLLEVDKSA